MQMPKSDNPLDRRLAIMDLFDRGEVSGSCTVDQLVQMVGGTARGIGVALKDLGFVITRISEYQAGAHW